MKERIKIDFWTENATQALHMYSQDIRAALRREAEKLARKRGWNFVGEFLVHEAARRMNREKEEPR